MMEKKKLQQPIPESLDDDALENVSGGLVPRPTSAFPYLIVHQDISAEDDTLPVGAITEE